MKEIVIKDDLLESLAAKDHELWMEFKIADGYHLHKDCPYKNQPRCALCNDLLVPFEQLQEKVKEINRLRWRTVPQTLALNGFVIVEKAELDKELAEKEELRAQLAKQPERKEDVRK